MKHCILQRSKWKSTSFWPILVNCVQAIDVSVTYLWLSSCRISCRLRLWNNRTTVRGCDVPSWRWSLWQQPRLSHHHLPPYPMRYHRHRLIRSGIWQCVRTVRLWLRRGDYLLDLSFLHFFYAFFQLLAKKTLPFAFTHGFCSLFKFSQKFYNIFFQIVNSCHCWIQL